MSNKLQYTPTIIKIEASNSLTDLRERLKAEHAAAAKAVTTGLSHAMAAGDILIEAKAQVKHGQWLPWLELCGVSERSAQRYIRLAKHRTIIEEKSDTVSDLGISDALMLLAVPRDTGDPVADQLADVANHAIERGFDFLRLYEAKVIQKKQKALITEAQIAVDKIGEIASKAPHLVELLERDPERLCERLTAACGELFSAEAAAMGFTVDEFKLLITAVDDLKAHGVDDDQIALKLGRKFNLLREPLPDGGLSPMVLRVKVRDIAVEWLQSIENATSQAPSG